MTDTDEVEALAKRLDRQEPVVMADCAAMLRRQQAEIERLRDEASGHERARAEWHDSMKFADKALSAFAEERDAALAEIERLRAALDRANDPTWDKQQ